MEDALKASEKFNLALLGNSPNQIVVINPDTSIRYVNRALEKANGWTESEVK
jgi:PAS domain S-box-containing protein